jgi:uncharacterized protein YcfJ
MKTTLKTLIAIGLAATTLIATADTSFARSKASYCRAQARNYARHVGGDHVVNGLALGAITGGVFGALTGGGAGSNIATGLAVGGIAGGLGGAVSGSEAKRRAYYEAYQDCMGNY